MTSGGFWQPSFGAVRRAEAIVGALAIALLPTLILAAWPAPASDSAFDSARLEVLLQRNPTTGRPVDSIAELVPLLPRELRSNFTFVYDSRSPFRSSISPQFPRVILFTRDAREAYPAVPGSSTCSKSTGAPWRSWLARSAGVTPSCRIPVAVLRRRGASLIVRAPLRGFSWLTMSQ
jgi:hypothetical protein